MQFFVGMLTGALVVGGTFGAYWLWKLDAGLSSGPGKIRGVLAAAAAAGAAIIIAGVGVFSSGATTTDPARIIPINPTKNAAFDIAQADSEIARIEKYLASTKIAPQLLASPARMTSPAVEGLPDVETMIAGLAKRLEAEPGDVDGWRTLGWSYANTSRPAEAVKAYQRAVALAPDQQDLKDALAQAQRATSTSAR